jgi:hypothetical protein
MNKFNQRTNLINEPIQQIHKRTFIYIGVHLESKFVKIHQFQRILLLIPENSESDNKKDQILEVREIQESNK